MERQRCTYTFRKGKRGFTLLEVLLVLVLIGILFGLISYTFYSLVTNSLSLAKDSERLKEDASLLWNIQRKILSSKSIYLEKDKLFIITSAGDYYEGMVKCAYIYKDGILYYYEFPYPYGDIRFYEEDKLIKLGRFDTISFRAYKGGNFYDTFDGIPELIYVKMNNREFVIRIL
ncbi:MAG: prepilin-type N-terminal cleavage/methylation domain-containing protein [Hydrogenobacter sp.]